MVLQKKSPLAAAPRITNFSNLVVGQSYIATRIGSTNPILVYRGLGPSGHCFEKDGNPMKGIYFADTIKKLRDWGLVAVTEEGDKKK